MHTQQVLAAHPILSLRRVMCARKYLQMRAALNCVHCMNQSLPTQARPTQTRVPADARLRALYICYYPLTEPLVQTQVVAYLRGLAARGHVIHLLTYEVENLSPRQKRALRRELKAQGIIWHHLRYHSRPTVPATVYDSLCGIARAVQIVRRYRLNCVHARSHVPALMATKVKLLTGAKMIFDIRGLLAEEYVDAGSWTRDGLPFRLTKAAQKLAIANADGIVTLTQRVRRVLFDANYTPQNDAEKSIGLSPVLPRDTAILKVIPCCADLSGIEAQSDQRDQMRRELGLQDKRVVVYVGKFGGWYLQREMVEWFKVAYERDASWHFLILSQSDHELARVEFERCGLPPESYTLTSAPHQRIGAYLASGDVAISFIAAMPSKIASSPTKIGEYLAAGLAVISNPGVGDVDADLEQFAVGVVVPEFNQAAYRESLDELETLLNDKSLASRCRRAAHETVALEEIGVARYDELYRALAKK